MSAAPFTAFCPTCDGRRTFTYSFGSDAMVCVVCGGRDVIEPVPLAPAPLAELPDERLAMPEALELLESARAAIEVAARDDRETLGELAGTVVYHGETIAELRDDLIGAVSGLARLVARVSELERRLDLRDAA